MFYILLKSEWVEYTPPYLGGGPVSNLSETLPSLARDNGQKAFRSQSATLGASSLGSETGVHAFISKNLHSIDASVSLFECYKQMQSHKVHHLIVKKDNQFFGIISDRDLNLVKKLPGSKSISVGEITTTVVLAASEDVTIDKVALVFEREEISCLPILNEDNEVFGVLTTRDLFRFIYERCV